jgi:uncharacterized protein
MAGTSLLMLIDDIASVLDDVALMTKVAAKKTAGVLGDDLALNAQQVTGVAADRELPVVWAVARGSLVNKAILVPAALAISAVLPQLIMPLLMLGGAYLCYEGAEKLAHRFLHEKTASAADRAAHLQALSDATIDRVAFEKDKIKGAVRTDFILSAEIIVIALGAAAAAPFGQRVAVLVGISALMTVGVYGLVAGIVKLDDAGLYLFQRRSSAARALGAILVRAAPWLMKALAVIGTAAMFLVGGSILAHGIPGVHDAIHHLLPGVRALPAIGSALALALPTLLDAVIGILAGAVVLAMVALVRRVRRSGLDTA